VLRRRSVIGSMGVAAVGGVWIVHRYRPGSVRVVVVA
jgi:hypothetical protein